MNAPREEVQGLSSKFITVTLRGQDQEAKPARKIEKQQPVKMKKSENLSYAGNQVKTVTQGMGSNRLGQCY